MSRRSVLTLDEQLQAFCEQWIAARQALAAKWTTRARDYGKRHGEKFPTIAALVYANAKKRAATYEHETKMLRELHRRSALTEGGK